MAYRTAAGTSQVLRYFYPLMADVQEGMGYQEYLAALQDIAAEDPTALANATIQDRQAMWTQINDQIDAIDAFAAADPTAPVDASMWSWAPGHQLTTAASIFESYQIRVEFTTSSLPEGETLTRTVTLDGSLADYTVEGLEAEIAGLLQIQLDEGDTPPEGGWGPEGPGTMGDLTNVTIMRL